MDSFLNCLVNEANNMSIPHQGIERCPFLRNIIEPTHFAFASPPKFPVPVRGAKGPIFEDGPNFDTAFKLFHGRDGVVPLSGRFLSQDEEDVKPEPITTQFNPLAAKAATISMSSFGFGPGGPFSFDSFIDKFNKQNKNSSKNKKSSKVKNHHQLPIISFLFSYG